MKIEIWSDVVCPFCYIGKRRLEKAIGEMGLENEVELIWKSFLLDPQAPAETSGSSLEYLSRKKGWSMEQTLEMTDRVTGIAAEEGLVFNMQDTKHANTLQAHRLIQLAKEKRLANEMEERLFKAYFTEGKNIGDLEVLKALGAEVGIEESVLQHFLAEKDAFRDKVEADLYEGRQIGVTAVPFFVIDEKYAISGAQPTELFMKALSDCQKV
ncbi:DsbA family oxidoreductase [Pleomorphovibrio marinus]|uniref:DsbA family oxidoreductase n=1 Tax=Pleomorphovibrio marinus TaxID=2164132 RepID=UPI000E0BE484|nr:DsbA family oxidoreductase [Pleomorphovibrio marinus]